MKTKSKENMKSILVGSLLLIGIIWLTANFTKQSIFIELPSIYADESGTITLAGSDQEETHIGAIWIDGEAVRCGSMDMGGLSYSVENAEEGEYRIDGYMVSYSGSAFPDGDYSLCQPYNSQMNNVMNLVTESGLQNLANVQPGYRFNAKTVTWRVGEKPIDLEKYAPYIIGAIGVIGTLYILKTKKKL